MLVIYNHYNHIQLPLLYWQWWTHE